MWEEDKSKSDDQSDRNYLKAHAKETAKALDDLAKTHDWKTSPLADDTHVYWEWKRAYRRVLGRCFRKIYSKEFILD